MHQRDTPIQDHLGSTSLTTDDSGAKVSEIRYKAWGEIRYSWTAGVSTTPAYQLANYTFTGQFSYMDNPTTNDVEEGFGLMFYNARWYDPYLNHFTQPDSIVPDQTQGVQAWDRYAYANNNPIRYNDPTGHCPMCIGAAIGAAVNIGLYLWSESQQADGIDLHIDVSIGSNGLNVDVGNDWGDVLVAGAEGAVAGALIATPGGVAVATTMGTTMGGYLVGDQVGNIVAGEDFSAEDHMIAGMVGLGQGFGAAAIGMGGLSPTSETIHQIVNASFWNGEYTELTDNSASGFVTGAITQGASSVWLNDILKTYPEAGLTEEIWTSWFPSTTSTTIDSFFNKHHNKEDEQ